MAEAVVNSRLSQEWQAFSAGTHPAGYIHPKALQVLAEIGIQHHGRSKDVAEYLGMPFDMVITVCDSAAEECPVWLGAGSRVHLSFPDPAKQTGSEEQIIAAFRQVRDDIAARILALMADLSKKSDLQFANHAN
jgi:arsenate reductase